MSASSPGGRMVQSKPFQLPKSILIDCPLGHAPAGEPCEIKGDFFLVCAERAAAHRNGNFNAR